MQVISDENHMVGAIFYGLKILVNENECDRFCSYQQGYKDWVNKNGPELRLPGLNMTNEQLLFVSFAQVKIWIEVFEVFKILWWDTLCGLDPSFFGEVRRTSQTKTSVNNKLMFALYFYSILYQQFERMWKLL